MSEMIAARDPGIGLSSFEVSERVGLGQINEEAQTASRSYADIVRANVLTWFNLLLAMLLALVIAFGPPQDALFGIVPIVNTLIGIVQEVRTKHVLDRLAILSRPKAVVMRDMTRETIPVAGIVVDDALELRSGDQVPVDCRVLSDRHIEVDESILTGEAAPVEKGTGEPVLAGSVVLAGSGWARVTSVGDHVYARRLASEARRFHLIHSDLVDSISKLIRVLTWLVFPVGALLFFSQLRSNQDWQNAIDLAAAGVIAMVPQGLVLLTTITFGAAAVKLSRGGVLVQQLQAVEGLARVDIICFDKTGTITDGRPTLDRFVALGAAQPLEDAFVNLTGMEPAEAGGTSSSVDEETLWEPRQVVPFSSARRWTGAVFRNHGTWVMGAPEVLLPLGEGPLREQAATFASQGKRVLLLATTLERIGPEAPPARLNPAGFVLLTEHVRPEAARTLGYFQEQGVAVKV